MNGLSGWGGGNGGGKTETTILEQQLKKKIYGSSTQQNTMQQKETTLTFCNSIMGLETIMLTEISQLVKAKYHMISPINGTKSTK